MKKDKIGTFMLKTACPWCGKKMDRLVAAEEMKVQQKLPPSEGDVCLCIGCGMWAVYDGEKALRKPTEEEVYTIFNNFDCLMAMKAWTELTGGGGIKQ
jgi:hypothetical protein